MKFNQLVADIKLLHAQLQQESVRSINTYLTLRNWIIGFYIQEFEQKGENRAEYGVSLLPDLAQKLAIKGLVAAELSRCRQFYRVYPQLATEIVPRIKAISSASILGTVSQRLSQTEVSPILGTLSQESDTHHSSLVKKLITNLSFSHLVELIKIEDGLQRKFYEIECIKGSWSVRELRRHISTLYYERCGLSNTPDELSKRTLERSEPQLPSQIIKSVYSFDFLGLDAKDIVEEKDLETALINHLQEFMIELGRGFCFEARQKRLLIDDDYYFADLVFYHRLLKCHIIIELKTDRFKHQYLSQLNTYVSYYREEVMTEGDNLPIGILLCTQKGKKLVEYALSGMDEQLFVSKYLIDLPSKEILTEFIMNEMNQLGNK